MKRFLLRSALFSLLLLLVLELFFRFVLPAAEWPKTVALESGILRFDPETFQTGRYTYGRTCRRGGRWSINEQGWNSMYEYELPASRDRPLVALVGDSYLEGFYTDVDQHIDALLSEMFEDTVRFYAFAMSGGILSQYLALMRYEIEPYGPDAYVIFLNTSDVRRSFRELGGIHPFFFQYSPDSTGTHVERHPEAVPARSGLRDLLLGSAVIRYMRGNARIPFFGGGLADENLAPQPGGGPVPGEPPIELLAAADFLLGELGTFGRPVILLADCPKDWIYEGGEETAYDDVIALRESVENYPDIVWIELSPVYREAWAAEARVFSPPDNTHWNAYANRLIAGVLYGKIATLLDL